MAIGLPFPPCRAAHPHLRPIPRRIFSTRKPCNAMQCNGLCREVQRCCPSIANCFRLQLVRNDCFECRLSSFEGKVRDPNPSQVPSGSSDSSHHTNLSVRSDYNGWAWRIGWDGETLRCAALRGALDPGPAPRSSPLILACPEASGPAEVACSMVGSERVGPAHTATSSHRILRLQRTSSCHPPTTGAPFGWVNPTIAGIYLLSLFMMCCHTHAQSVAGLG